MMSKRKNTSITSFFTCASKRTASSDNNAVPATEEPQIAESTPPRFEFIADIGIVSSHSLTKEEKYFLLTDDLFPPANFQWPYEERKDGERLVKRFLSKDHLTKHPYLAYSIEKKGLFCKVCVLFGDITAAQKTGSRDIFFFTRAFTKYARMFRGGDGYVDKHAQNAYHKTALSKSLDFQRAFEHPNESIDLAIDKTIREEVERNRRALKPIIETIIFASKLGLPLRGHRDDGTLSVPNQLGEIDTESGNLRALLQFKAASGDVVLADHLKNSKKTLLILGSWLKTISSIASATT